MFAVVMSDWGAHHATLDAIQGLDVSDDNAPCKHISTDPIFLDVNARR